jgi:sortase (surface protein transpeptidase)
VVHTCNPTHFKGRDWEDHSSRTAWEKMFVRPHLNKKKLGMVVCTCYPNYAGRANRRIIVQGQSKQKYETSKNN